MAELMITFPDGRTVRHALTAGPHVVGRDGACDIPLDHPSTSRRHARFVPAAAGYIVEDLGSKNGTLVNDLPCQNEPLKDGDRILIGAVLVVYSDGRLDPSQSVVVSDDLPSSHSTRYVSRSERLLLPQRRLQMIYELSGRLTTLQDRDRLLEDALAICFETLQFERGAIGIRRLNQRTVDWPVVRNLRGREGELTVSRTLLSRALEHGERAIFTAGDKTNTDPTVSMVQHGIRSAMCVPLLDQHQTLGVIYGDRVSTSAIYTNEDIDFLAAIAQQVSIGLVNCRLLEERQQMIRLDHDLDLARRIQNGLFPANLPNRDGLIIAALNDPGQRISGDYYDVIETEDGRVWCLMADVTGEGIAAALLMANLQAAVRATIQETDDPGTHLTRWNRLICRNTEGSKFVTCLLALIDPKSAQVRFAAAGHPDPLVIRGSKTTPESLSGVEAGYPLGVVENASFTTTTVDLSPPPFVFFCYTDGVIEALNADGEPFGIDRLAPLLSDPGSLSPQALVKQVRKSIAEYVGGAPQSDDITMLAVAVG